MLLGPAFEKPGMYTGFHKKSRDLLLGCRLILAKNGLRHRRRNCGSGWWEPDPSCLSGEHHRQHDPILPCTVSAVRDHHRVRLPRSGAFSDCRSISIGRFDWKIRKLWVGVWG